MSPASHPPLGLGLLGRLRAPAIQWQAEPVPAFHPLRPPLAGEGTSSDVHRSLVVWGEEGVQRAEERARLPGSHARGLQEEALGSTVYSDLDRLVLLIGSGGSVFLSGSLPSAWPAMG